MADIRYGTVSPSLLHGLTRSVLSGWQDILRRVRVFLGARRDIAVRYAKGSLMCSLNFG